MIIATASPAVLRLLIAIALVAATLVRALPVLAAPAALPTAQPTFVFCILKADSLLRYAPSGTCAAGEVRIVPTADNPLFGCVQPDGRVKGVPSAAKCAAPATLLVIPNPSSPVNLCYTLANRLLRHPPPCSSSSEAALMIPPANTVDLTASIDCTPEPVGTRQQLTCAMTIANAGTQPATISTGVRLLRVVVPAGMINLAVSTPAGYTCFIEASDATTITVDCQTTAAQTIAAGSSLAATLFGTAPASGGTVQVTLTADPLDAVDETDEANNAATDTVTVVPPDLTASIACTPDPVGTGGAIECALTIANAGSQPTRLASTVRLLRVVAPAGVSNLAVAAPNGYTCDVAGANSIECRPTTSQTLAAGGSVAFTLTGTAPTSGGTIEFVVTADPEDTVDETDETNNSATDTVAVQ